MQTLESIKFLKNPTKICMSSSSLTGKSTNKIKEVKKKRAQVEFMRKPLGLSSGLEARPNLLEIERLTVCPNLETTLLVPECVKEDGWGRTRLDPANNDRLGKR